MGTRTISATAADDRFLVDVRDVGEASLADFEVVHHIEEIDVAVVRGDEDDLAGMDYTRDVTLELDLPESASIEEVEEVDAYDDRFYYLQWDKESQLVPYLHWQTRGAGTRVAVIDSGVYGDHPDLSHAVNGDLSRNMTTDDGDYFPNGTGDHGTHVAGTIAANDDNEAGVVGTAPAAEIVALRVFSNSAGGSFGTIIAAMVYAGTVGCDVANMSLGAYPLPKDNVAVKLLKRFMERAVDYGNEQGCLYVAAAGNDGTNLDTDGDVISLPNEADNVMSIAATGPIGFRWDDDLGWGDPPDIEDALQELWAPTYEPAFYTNHGEEAIDLSAPGGNFDRSVNGDKKYYDLVLSTVFSRTQDGVVPSYGWKAGTSMAAPNVSGAAALVAEQHPDATPKQLREHLEATADDVGDDTYHGEGHLNVASAVRTDIDDA